MTVGTVSQAAWLSVGIGAVLVLATLIGRMLAWRAAGGGSSVTIDNLNARINAWWAMAALVGGAFVFGRAGVLVLFFLVSLLALREFITLLPTRRADYWPLVVTFYLALPLQYVLVGMNWYGMFSIFIPVYGFLLLPILAALGRDNSRFLERAATVQWALMVGVYCISYVPALMMLHIPGYEHRQLLLIAFLVVVVQSSDVLQYVWGKLFGRHKIAPVLSPSKTWEGLVGGVACASLLGGLLWWITPFSFWQAAGMALVINLMGFLGGLVMSAIKRDRGVKDWGHMIEGHGGVLDRLDSVCFAAPVFFHLTRYFWT